MARDISNCMLLLLGEIISAYFSIFIEEVKHESFSMKGWTEKLLVDYYLGYLLMNDEFQSIVERGEREYQFVKIRPVTSYQYCIGKITDMKI